MGIKDSLNEQGLRPRKKWGQNFLTDPRILTSIIEAGDVTLVDTVLEIGPGMGHLTRMLAERARQVVAVEIDAALGAKLQKDFANSTNVKVLQGDVLTRPPMDWLALAGAAPHAGSGFKIIANLPYYITSAILRHILEAPARPHVVVVMVQREVAQRMISKPPDMNLLAVGVQFFARVHLVRVIAPGAFYPRPKVSSAVVRLDVTEPPSLPEKEIPGFFELVRAGFGEKRKQLRNSLAHGLGLAPHRAEDLLRRAKIDPTRRAETLVLEEWNRLYHVWAGTRIAEPN